MSMGLTAGTIPDWPSPHQLWAVPQDLFLPTT
jgi:hypothetical protein